MQPQQGYDRFRIELSTSEYQGTPVDQAQCQSQLGDNGEVRALSTFAGLMVVAISTGSCALLPSTVVPEQYRSHIEQSAKQCKKLSAGVLAAQLDQESGWDPAAVSARGAEGIAQFMPETWTAWGRDANGNGQTSPFEPQDAIDSQGRLMCHLITKAQESGFAGGNVKLALAGYNAGWGAVEEHEGLPPFPETTSYVQAIMEKAPDYKLAIKDRSS
jgi:soluble lytic murein transglycosylase-like protein